MSSPCLSGSTYVLDLELVKSTSRTSQISPSSFSSPSSIVTESGSSPLAIVSTRKARTPRKRPNQTYNEAAALLSTACPNIFSTKQFTTSFSTKFPYNPHVRNISSSISNGPFLLEESSELLLPFRVFDNSGFLLHQPVKDSPGAGFFGESRAVSNLVTSPSCQSSSGTTWDLDSMEVFEGYREDDSQDFDAGSILDGEVEEGIDSIMGNLSVGNEVVDGSTRGSLGSNCYFGGGGLGFDPWYAHAMSFGEGGRCGGLRIGGVRVFRRVHDGNCQNFPVVDMLQISPRLDINKSLDPKKSNWDSNSEPKLKPNSRSGSNPNPSAKLKLKLTFANPKPRPNPEDKKKKKKKVERPISELMNVKSANEASIEESPIPELVNSGLNLKLNYDEVLDAWSDRGMPFPEEIAGAEGTDVSIRLAQIDLFSENEGLREASILRYKEKRQTRLYSKKIRYQVRKVNADQRPRNKGRFVRRFNGSLSHQRGEEC